MGARGVVPEGGVGVDSARQAICYRFVFAWEFASELGDTAGGYGIPQRIPMRIPQMMVGWGTTCRTICRMWVPNAVVSEWGPWPSTDSCSAANCPWFDHQTSDVAGSPASSAGIGCR